jgi:addiction module RelB/DinJ family antitoxin
MKTLINIKVDKDIKIQAQNLSHNLGIPLSTLVNAYLRQFVREKKAVFTTAWQMSPELEKILGPIENDIKAGRNLSKFISMPEELNEIL